MSDDIDDFIRDRIEQLMENRLHQNTQVHDIGPLGKYDDAGEDADALRREQAERQHSKRHDYYRGLDPEFFQGGTLTRKRAPKREGS